MEFDSNMMTDSIHPLPEEAVVTTIPTDGDLHTANTGVEESQGLVVLAHNPSLKKKLSVGPNRRPGHQRSASDFDENITQELDNMPAGGAIEVDSEPVPLDPIVHPPEPADGEVIEPKPRISRSANNSQRALKRVTDVSPVHERVAPSLASKNLLVKVVKADFIDLKSELIDELLCIFLHG